MWGNQIFRTLHIWLPKGCFGYSISFWECHNSLNRRWNSVMKGCFWSSLKCFGIHKMKLGFQNINWEFRGLGHISFWNVMSCQFCLVFSVILCYIDLVILLLYKVKHLYNITPYDLIPSYIVKVDKKKRLLWLDLICRNPTVMC